MSQRLTLATSELPETKTLSLEEELKAKEKLLLASLEESTKHALALIEVQNKLKTFKRFQVLSDSGSELNQYVFLACLNAMRSAAHVLEPDPKPFPASRKDERAYQKLLQELKEDKPLADLATHIHKRSRFLRIGSEIAAHTKEKKDLEEIKSNHVDVVISSMNIACLTEIDIKGVPIFQTNWQELRPNHERIEDIVNFYKRQFKLFKPDFICLQEAFDMRDELKKRFVEMGYKWVGDEGQKFLNVGSGLLIFFNTETVSVYATRFEPHERKQPGAESFANKGISQIESIIKKNGKKFAYTLFVTHMLTPGFSGKAYKKQGTSSEARDLECRRIDSLSKYWISEPIKDETGKILPHASTAFTGDFNDNYSRLYHFLGITTGMAPSNGFTKTGRIKYAGRHGLFLNVLTSVNKYSSPLTMNAIEVRALKEERDGEPKRVDPDRERYARLENLATGSSFSKEHLALNKKGLRELTLQDTENKHLDVAAVFPDQSNQLFFERYGILTTVAGADAPKDRIGKAITDHTATIAFHRFDLAPENKSQKECNPMLELDNSKHDAVVVIYDKDGNHQKVKTVIGGKVTIAAPEYKDAPLLVAKPVEMKATPPKTAAGSYLDPVYNLFSYAASFVGAGGKAADKVEAPKMTTPFEKRGL